ncbi:MAG TPA: LysR substrate-binding domain-containing protein [Rhizomicrobium sp.]|nr:LysR substrate-binding domain-containing protein [Rhizomicrobium sp.]
MDRFEAMSVVLAVAEAGSLSEAARREKTPLATISRKVSELEAHLETKLFNRSSRALVLTDAGRSFVAATKRILADVAEAERAASGEYATPRGELTLSAPIALGRILLLPIVGEFLKSFPEVDVQLGLTDRAVNLLEEHVDLAFRIGELADSSLIAIRVGEIHRVVCASPEYLEARGTPRTPDELQGHDCISFVPMLSPKSWTFTRDQKVYDVPVQSRLVVGSMDAACEAARAGIGIAMAFSYSIAASVKAGTLVRLLDAYQPPPRPVSLVYSSNRFMPIKLRAFLDFAVPRLKEGLADMERRAPSKGRAAKA